VRSETDTRRIVEVGDRSELTENPEVYAERGQIALFKPHRPDALSGKLGDILEESSE